MSHLAAQHKGYLTLVEFYYALRAVGLTQHGERPSVASLRAQRDFPLAQFASLSSYAAGPLARSPALTQCARRSLAADCRRAQCH